MPPGEPALSTTRAVAIIPARLGSTRFPAKVLADRTGRPLIRHVWEAARRAASLSRVVIATDDQRVLGAAKAFGAEAVMTRADHPNGTSRLDEAAAILGLGDDELIVNVQGDEPELEPGIIDAAVRALTDRPPASPASIGTVAVPFSAEEDPRDEACVKVVAGLSGLALYFSRSVIPFDRDSSRAAAPMRHIGIYAYRRSFLRTYIALKPTPLERTEQLEQLRALEHGHAIAVAVCPSARQGIDTPEQYEAFVRRWFERHPRG